MLLLDTGARKVDDQLATITPCVFRGRCVYIYLYIKKIQFRAEDDVHLMLSAASLAVYTGYSMCGCVLAFPSLTPFLRVGCRGMAIGKKKKKRKGRREGGGGGRGGRTIEEVVLLVLSPLNNQKVLGSAE